jgi:iron complex outermembrane receptor protein
MFGHITRGVQVYSILRTFIIPFTLIVGVGCLQALQNDAHSGENEFLDMDITELMQVTITSVAKKPQNLSKTPAAVYVITQEDLRRTGVTTIPEALRMAPGVQVARISSSKWAVTARGLNGLFANKLLVMVDGRTVYSPTFSGTYWDMQNPLLEDIDRIEVIRGPGATVWGANAVNGVINIITKDSGDTIGGLVAVGAGTNETGMAGMRYGGRLSEVTTGRIYLKYNERDSGTMWLDGSDAYDSWNNLNLGFRLDGQLDGSSWTLQGDVYRNDEDQRLEPFITEEPPFVSTRLDNVDASGWNVLGRYQKELRHDSSLTLQMYYDSADREEGIGSQYHNTLDLDMHYQTAIGKRHELMFGLGYRVIDSEFTSSLMASIDSDDRKDKLFSGFIQDAISLVPEKLWLTVGTKWEHNNFTGNEVQPTARLLWNVSDSQVLWTSISRAVRTPSQFEWDGQIFTGLVLPGNPPELVTTVLRGSSLLTSEEVIAYEAGYRLFPASKMSFDVSLFYNDYSDLVATVIDPQFMTAGSLVLTNGISGYSYGAEVVMKYQLENWLGLGLTYMFSNASFEAEAGMYDIGSSLVYENSSPQHQISLQATTDIRDNLQLNVWLRYVGELEMASAFAGSIGLEIDDYLECDVNLRWRLRDDFELQLVGQNLLQSEHLEFSQEFFAFPVEVERGVYLKALYRF